MRTDGDWVALTDHNGKPAGRGILQSSASKIVPYAAWRCP